ncbi:MAG TPA: ABC transporter substrate-binding protein [Polyangiaceae bacterium]|nr:ABC transporter substrate-binding protein [Polyangiaceae bacterium]
MQLTTRVYFAGLAMLCGCGTSDKGNGVPGSPDAASDASSTTPPDAADNPDGPSKPSTDGGACSSNLECTERATMAALDAGKVPDGPEHVVPAICVRSEGRCAELLSEDCSKVTGNYKDTDAIVIATLLSTAGVQSATNLQRQQAAALAVEQIDAVGGIPAVMKGGSPRPLVMVSCDEGTNLMRAARHLVSDLRVQVIVGPNTSQDTLDVANNLTIQEGTLLITPTAVASSITDLVDNDLSWLMVPSDAQRGKLMINQINAIEQDRKTAGKTAVRLAVIYRNDALGTGTRRSLDDLVLNGRPLSDPINAGSPTGNVILEGYEVSATDQNALVARLVTFAPDIVVLAGTAEAITTVMNPLEQQWPDAGSARPAYLLIDSVKVPELIAAAANADLRARIRGSGLRPGPESQPIATAFELDFRARYGMTPTASGVGPSYDATYAIAYALAATHDQPISGASMAKGLRKLAGGSTVVTVGASSLATAFTRLGASENITSIGTCGPFDWDARGAIKGGVIEVWCIGAPAGTPAYQSSGLAYDVKSDTFSGNFMRCSP